MNRLVPLLSAVVASALLASCGGDPEVASSRLAPADPIVETSVQEASRREPVTVPDLAASREEPPPSVSYAGQVTTTPTSTTPTSTTTTTASTTTSSIPVSLPVADSACAVTLPADAFFESGGSELSVDSQRRLIQDVAPIVSCLSPTALLRVEAWTDDRGDAQYNLDLSDDRVAAAVGVIIGEWPDVADRVVQVGHGEADSPTSCTGDCPENRVVTATVVPEGDS